MSVVTAPQVLRRLRWTWLPGNIGLALVWGAITAVLLAVQIQRIDPAGKVGHLAVATSLGALVTMLVQPVAGQLSDRTRSRLGRRAPWIIGGAATGTLAMIGMSFATSIPALIGMYLVVVVTYNSAQLPMSAVLPDRVPENRRGTFSALAGAGQMLGNLGGQVIASRLAGTPGVAYWVVAGLTLVFTVGFVLLNPDVSSREVLARPLGWLDLLRSYWVNPRRHPDFGWVFLGRFLLMSGYFISNSYQLYLLQDYVGLGERAVDYMPLLALTTLVMVIVFTLVGGPLSDRSGGRRKVFIYVSGCLFALGLLVPLLMPTLTGMVVASVIGGMGFGVFGSVDGALMTEVLPSREGYAKDLGVINLSFSLPQTLGPVLAGAVVTVTGGYAVLFPVGAALAVAGAFAVRFVKKVA
ncbi:MAG: MFS transporter [Nonomuraea sp.]|nr:MFS transporter [Nonomuraea sp.]